MQKELEIFSLGLTHSKFWGNCMVRGTCSKLYQPYFLEIYGIPYMKKVTEFREIPRNFTELYDMEFGGIPPEF
jgi:hypothetical protein